MASKCTSSFLLGMAISILCAVPLFGQATFSAGASPTVGADIGVTELTGGIVFSIESGTSRASSFIIQYSAPITNNSVNEIIVSGTGGLGAVGLRLNKDDGTVIIDVPGGANNGQIRMAGVRVALAEAQQDERDRNHNWKCIRKCNCCRSEHSYGNQQHQEALFSDARGSYHLDRRNGCPRNEFDHCEASLRGLLYQFGRFRGDGSFPIPDHSLPFHSCRCENNVPGNSDLI